MSATEGGPHAWIVFLGNRQLEIQISPIPTPARRGVLDDCLPSWFQRPYRSLAATPRRRCDSARGPVMRHEPGGVCPPWRRGVPSVGQRRTLIQGCGRSGTAASCGRSCRQLHPVTADARRPCRVHGRARLHCVPLPDDLPSRRRVVSCCRAPRSASSASSLSRHARLLAGSVSLIATCLRRGARASSRRRRARAAGAAASSAPRGHHAKDTTP